MPHTSTELQRHLDRIGLPPRFAAGLESWLTDLTDCEGETRCAIADAAETYLDILWKHLPKNNAPNLLLIGRAGAGKSHLAAAILVEYERRAYNDDRKTDALWLNVPDLFAQSKRAIGNRVESARIAEIERHARSAQLLVLDDLPSHGKSISPYEFETLYAIINTRYENMRTTLATLERDLEPLAHTITPALVGRLVEGAHCLSLFQELHSRRLSAGHPNAKPQETRP